MSRGLTRRLDTRLRPTAVELECPLGLEHLDAVEDELRTWARSDRNGCCGYFPALGACLASTTTSQRAAALQRACRC